MDASDTNSDLQESEEVDDVHIQAGSRVTTAGSSWYASVFLVVNAALGAGLLNFPEAYDQSGGLVTAISVQAVLMVFVILSLLVLTHCSDKHQVATYQDVVYSMCGRWAQLVSAVAIALYTFGTCVTFFVIIGDQWDKFLSRASVYKEHYCEHWYLNRKFTITITAFILVLPMCFPKRIDFLKYASFAGVLAIIYCVILVTAKYFIGPLDPGPIKTKPTHWTDVFVVVPVICFGYQCHLSVVPIYSCLRKRTVREFSKSLLVAMALCVFAYTVTASFGYLSFGSDVNPDILLSYSPTTDVLIAVALVALKMYTTYPILLFVGRVALEGLWLYFRNLTPSEIAMGEKRRRIVMVMVWFLATLLVALVVPNISIVISYLGALAAIFAFVFPGICLLKMCLDSETLQQFSAIKYWSMFVTAVWMIVFGTFIFGLVLTQSVMDTGHQHTHHKLVCD